MKVTKFVHSCLMVEMPAPVNRTAIFDPGVFSEEALDVSKLEYLDDIFITHNHADHMSPALLKLLVEKFPDVRITGPQQVVESLEEIGIRASSNPTEDTVFFKAPHEQVEPLFPRPDNVGIAYLHKFTNPGDSHTFDESKDVLALPITAPWGSTVKAVSLALELKPKYVLPIHDWHWSDAAREQTYDMLEGVFEKAGSTFVKLKTGEPVVLDV